MDSEVSGSNEARALAVEIGGGVGSGGAGVEDPPPPGYEFGNNSEESEPVPEESTEPRDDTNNGIPGFTSTLLFTAIAGALMYLKRRQNY